MELRAIEDQLYRSGFACVQLLLEARPDLDHHQRFPGIDYPGDLARRLQRRDPVEHACAVQVGDQFD